MDTEALESQMKAACGTGDYERAATLLFDGYGDELLSFLVARLRNQSDGQEAFSMFAEDLWSGLPNFAWRSSMRTWAYTIARNAANRYARSPQRRGERNLALSQNASLSQLVDRLRTRTETYRRTDAKDRVRSLRERLEPDDQMLLVLRIDRGMSWRDLAHVMVGDVDAGSDSDSEVLTREAARLRKRFERVKLELKHLAQEEGLLQ